MKVKAENLRGEEEHEMHLPKAVVKTDQSFVMCNSVKDRIVLDPAELSSQVLLGSEHCFILQLRLS